MDRDQLRTAVLAGIARMQGSWLFMRALTQQEKDILAAQKALYAADDDVVDKLLAKLPAEGRPT